MKYTSEDQCVEHQTVYPDLTQDLQDHDFQRRRVASSADLIRRGDIVLDIGCNSGYLIDFAPQAGEIHGVDVNPVLIMRAAERLTSAQTVRGETLPFPDKTFDFVHVSGILEQCYDPDTFLREAARVSRRSLAGNTVYEGGTWGTHRIERHVWQARSFSEVGLRALLERFGTIVQFGTVDVNTPPEPQCFFFEIDVH